MTEESEGTPIEDLYRHVRDRENKLESEMKAVQAMPGAEATDHRAMVQHVGSVLMEVLTELRSKREPAEIFAAAMNGLNKIQQEQFILRNILESLKQGKELSDIMADFEALGLLSTDRPTDTAASNQETGKSPPDDEPESQQQTAPAESTTISILRRLFKGLGRASMWLLDVALPAARAAGKFVEVVPTIGFAGPVPTVSLQLQPKGASIDELIEIVMGILEQS